MIQLHIAKGCGPTGHTLGELLIKEGVKLGRGGGHVYWGFSGAPDKALNAFAGRYNKLQELQVLQKAGVTTVPVHTHVTYAMHMVPFKFPVLARKLKHHGGRDIILCKGPIGVRKALKRGRAFFTQLIPSTTEYRCWIYRGRHLGTYEKVLAHPELRHRAIGRNHKNGYAFELVEQANIPRQAVALATQAIAALGLDFGAVDILKGTDGAFYTLEVNTAPGVEGPTRQVIQSLAHRIARWEVAGYPGRKVENA